MGHKIWVQFGLDGIEPSGSKFGSNKFRLVLSVNHFKFELGPQVMLNLNGSKFGFNWVKSRFGHQDKDLDKLGLFVSFGCTNLHAYRL